MSFRFKSAIVIVLIVITGTVVGYGLSKSKTTKTVSNDLVKTSTEAGYKDTKMFESIVSGIIKKGGLLGDGTHSLIQDSNPKNPAALLSSVVDLDEYVDKHVQIWGRSQKGLKASWLLEVGYIKVLD